MRNQLISTRASASLIFAGLLSFGLNCFAQSAITHQIKLPQGETWCDDGMINSLFTQINSLRSLNGVAPLAMDGVGMKDAEVRATQVIDYFAANQFGSMVFNPHQGYDTTAASLGYNTQGENLAWITTDPNYVTAVVWQDSLHLAAMLRSSANVAGVSCVFSSSGTAFWTFEPGYSTSITNPVPVQPTTPTTPSVPTTPTTPTTPPAGSLTLDSEELAFLTLINNYRAQNGVGPLQVSVALQTSSLWMSTDMGQHNNFAHTDSLGRGPQARMVAFGYTYSPWGENVAGGYVDAQSVFSGWQGACDLDITSGTCTYAHRMNMLSPNFKVIGIGRVNVPGSAYGWYWTTDFGGVVDQTIPTGTTVPPTGQGPVVNSFTASPSSLIAGQWTTLSWNVSGTTTATLNGSTVPAIGTMVMAPTQSTSYTLTASNSAGSTSAQASVTVAAVAAPVINSFTATPSTLTAGQSATLSWNVSQATSVTVNGTSTSGAGSTVVTPSQTTTYTLIASNSATSVTAQVTVKVNAASDTQPPSTPNLTSASAKSATEVDLIWTASSDNVAVAGYQVIRNGVVLITVGAGTLGFADSGVVAYTSYSYAIQAVDAAGNHSTSSNSMQVTTPPAPALLTCPGPAVGAFSGCYYNNTDLLGNPALVRTDNQINFNWGSGSPASGISKMNFSVRWQGIFNFPAGDYTFNTTMSDGFRFYIDGAPVRSAWRDLAPSMFLIQQTLTQGNHLLTVEYFEETGTATAILSWATPNAGPAPGNAPVINSFTASPSTVAVGQSSTLSWNVTGATTISINGTNVSGVGSMPVTPVQTTTYTLTATNSVSTVTGQSVVKVAAAADAQPPSTPNLTSASAKSATEVDLVWTASSDNVAVVGYQIIRNGIALNTVGSSSLGYVDTTVGANTTYSYVIQAFDAAGNHSLSSNSMQATTSSAPAVATCSVPAVGAFTGCYYNNPDLLGNPTLVRTDNQINFNWGSGAPASGVPAMNFSVRWQGIFNFAAGNYAFTATMSDGFRFYLDGVPVRSAWRDLVPSMFIIPQTITQGNHLITVEYYEHTGTGVAQLSWQKN